ncbi:MAG: sulfite exporter TauE/SafE family protein [Candidatus Tectomicrobia bacterium]|nr:sulfite exporter TauE/SafE family protein [Candidatus Tectomicrobia bacterium]
MSGAMLALFVAITVAGGLFKGATGFALPILTIPVLSLLLGPQEAVVMMSLPILLSNLADVRWGWSQWRSLRHIAAYVTGGVAAVPLGVYFLHRGDPDVIRLLIGLVVYLFLLVRRFGRPMQLQRPAARHGAGACLGALAGLLTGVSSLPGPVNLAYLSMFPKETFIFVLNVFNSLGSISQISTFALAGTYTPPALAQTAYAVVPVLAGYWAGLSVRDRLQQKTFAQIVNAALLCIATGLVGQSLWKFLS